MLVKLQREISLKFKKLDQKARKLTIQNTLYYHFSKLKQMEKKRKEKKF